MERKLPNAVQLHHPRSCIGVLITSSGAFLKLSMHF